MLIPYITSGILTALVTSSTVVPASNDDAYFASVEIQTRWEKYRGELGIAKEKLDRIFDSPEQIQFWAPGILECQSRTTFNYYLATKIPKIDINFLALAVKEIERDKFDTKACDHIQAAYRLISHGLLTKDNWVNWSRDLPQLALEYGKHHTDMFNFQLTQKWLSGENAVNRALMFIVRDGSMYARTSRIAQSFGFSDPDSLPKVVLYCGTVFKCYIWIQSMLSDGEGPCSEDCKIKMHEHLTRILPDFNVALPDHTANLFSLRRFLSTLQITEHYFNRTKAEHMQLLRNILINAISKPIFAALADSILLSETYSSESAIGKLLILNQAAPKLASHLPDDYIRYIGKLYSETIDESRFLRDMPEELNIAAIDRISVENLREYPNAFLGYEDEAKLGGALLHQYKEEGLVSDCKTLPECKQFVLDFFFKEQRKVQEQVNNLKTAIEAALATRLIHFQQISNLETGSEPITEAMSDVAKKSLLTIHLSYEHVAKLQEKIRDLERLIDPCVDEECG